VMPVRRWLVHLPGVCFGRMRMIMLMPEAEFVIRVIVLMPLFRWRGRPRRALFCPEFFPRQILFSGDPNVHLGCRNSAADDPRNLQARTDTQRRDGCFQHLCWNSGIHESAKEHVAAQAGETFEISDAHRQNVVGC